MTNYQSASLCVPCTLFMYSFVYLRNRYNVTIIPTLEMKILLLRNTKGPQVTWELTVRARVRAGLILFYAVKMKIRAVLKNFGVELKCKIRIVSINQSDHLNSHLNPNK